MHAGKRSTWDSGAWRPDARVSLGSAAVAVMLVTAGFTALFSAASFKLMQPAPAVREELVLAEPVPDLPPPRARPRLARPRLPLALPELPRMPPPAALAPLPGPDSFSVQDFLDERAKSNAAALKDQVTGKDLQRNLGKQTEKPAISDNQSYRTIDGQRVERGGGGCAESQTQQGSSSPTNHFEVGRPITCPGSTPDAGQEMGKALQDWADKHPVPPPPP